jgi:hypothetical protein
VAHARLSASAAHRWIPCAGSPSLCEGLPNKGSIHTATGSLAHDIAARCLTNPKAKPQMCLGEKATRDGYEVTCDQEMVDGVQFYLDTIKADLEKGDETFVEVDLTPAIAKIDADLGGTADHVRWRLKAQHLLVTDLKYGAGKVVEPTENKQLQIYALGVLLRLDKPVKEVTVRIIQPRIEHEDGRVRDWTFPAVDLLSFAADAAEFASRTRDANAPLVAGETQCVFCPARRVCPELEKQHHALVAAQFSELLPYDPQALSKALDSIPLVEARIKALREFAYTEAERGNPPPNYKLVAKRPARKWLSEEAIVLWAKNNAIKPFEDPAVKSPAQMEKGLSKAQKELMAMYVESISSGNVLAHESDKRPAVHKALAEEFAVLGEQK